MKIIRIEDNRPKKYTCAWCGKEMNYDNSVINHNSICSPLHHSAYCGCDKCVDLKNMIDMLYSKPPLKIF